ncbi:hypothetical protein CEE37_00165 [candidate division LCP-89 bacterium B3_LCP]|uniref:Uncharacterized protein n=1 Tax=candidate division LCP-89 bacterium B3_LCP TaxID=2012998 RepID=A0A532V4J5_UNCL8|nr:MAG: hypothetical protein CEE37_00165 [candidate division LCP-89 bacterium B3_LCP]
MSTINQELLKQLKNKLNTGITQIYGHVVKKSETTGLKREQAAIAVAMELGIDVSKYATEYDLLRIRETDPSLRKIIDDALPAKEETSEALREAQKNHLNTDPYLDNGMIIYAHQNAEICMKLFFLENSMRRVVSAIMATEYGIDWWYDVAPRDIMYSTFDRRSGEGETRWRGQFGAEAIYYTDIKDLRKIFEEHTELFGKFIDNLPKMDEWVDIVEKVRAAITFTNPVTNKDRDEFMQCVKLWSEIAKGVHERIQS